MRWRDIFSLAISALWQQRARTLLTLLGVLFGAFVLAASLAIGQGVQDAIAKYARHNELLRRVEVMPRHFNELAADASSDAIAMPGEMSEARRQRLRKAIARYQASISGRREQTRLTQDVLTQLAGVAHVESVIPLSWLGGFAVLDGKSQPIEVDAARPGDASGLKRLVAGRFFEKADEPSAVVSEFLLYRLGIVDEASTQAVLGKKLRLEFRMQRGEAGFAVFVVRPDGGQPTREEAAALEKVRRQLPGALDKLDLKPEEVGVLRKALTGVPAGQAGMHAQEFTIVGVMRMQSEEEEQAPWDAFRLDADVALPYTTAASLFFGVPGHRQEGVNRAVMIVDQPENVKAVVAEVRKKGLQGHAALEFIERQRLLYLLIFGGMTCVAAVAMLVAALGIANTMLISVLERTREIGIMKAVGAGNGPLQLVFLVEGALIGAVGGSLGLLLAWCASFPGDAWVRRIALRDLAIAIDESIFVFPAWLQITVLGSALLVTVLAAVYPARRAARLDPVAALRHE